MKHVPVFTLFFHSNRTLFADPASKEKHGSLFMQDLSHAVKRGSRWIRVFPKCDALRLSLLFHRTP